MYENEDLHKHVKWSNSLVKLKERLPNINMMWMSFFLGINSPVSKLCMLYQLYMKVPQTLYLGEMWKWWLLSYENEFLVWEQFSSVKVSDIMRCAVLMWDLFGIKWRSFLVINIPDTCTYIHGSKCMIWYIYRYEMYEGLQGRWHIHISQWIFAQINPPKYFFRLFTIAKCLDL